MRIYFSALFIFLTSCTDAEVKPKKLTEIIKPARRTLSYSQEKEKINRERTGLKSDYLQANDSLKSAILSKIGDYIRQTIGGTLYGYWRGTPWDFNGITTKPKEGTIACGYFVTTVLRDAGYKLERTKLSTCPSLFMMKSLASPGNVQNLSAMSFEKFQTLMKNNGKALFVVGLDFHTGFIVNDGKDCWFLHSNYIRKAGVMKEKLQESIALQSSKTRYVACLTRDKKFLRNWLLN